MTGVARFRDQVVLVTGAASGIGLALVTRLAAEGARVGLIDRAKGPLEAAAAAVREKGGEALALAADVRRKAEIEAAVARVEAAFGRLDALVCCAGLYPVTPLLSLDEAEWDEVLDTNLKAPFLCAQAAASAMIARGIPGRIVNVSSTAAVLARPGIAHYGASKAGLNQLTRILAVELAPHGILVNAVCPGVIGTERVLAQAETPGGRLEAEAKRARIPLGRFGRPDEVVGLVLYLLSPEASYCTGSLFTVDGGFTLGIPGYGGGPQPAR